MGWAHRSNSRFSQTRWSVVDAARDGATSESRDALEQLCRMYHSPVYAFLRQRGFSSHDAEDTAQGFFAHLLARPFLQNVGPGHGRFRTFLLASLEHFLINEWHRQQAQKRGGGTAAIPLDDLVGVSSREPAVTATSDSAFDREWAVTVVRRSFEQLRQECQQAGKAALFEELQGHLLHGDEPGDAPAIAARLSMGEPAVRQTRSRLRRRFREVLQDTIAETLSDPGEVEKEARYLVSICASDHKP